MSIRTLVELNHDCADQIGTEGGLHALVAYLASADKRSAERLADYGINVLARRHHSAAYQFEVEPEGLREAQDKIEALDSELRSAVSVAYKRGAKDWALLNYPQWADWLRSLDESDQLPKSQITVTLEQRETEG